MGIKAFDRISHPPDRKTQGAAATPLSPQLPALPVVSSQSPVYGPPLPTKADQPPPPRSSAIYVFKNRTVPPLPFGQRQNMSGPEENDDGVILALDVVSNSWILRGPPYEVASMERVAQQLDIKQDELDLDFLLVAVAEDWVASWGIDAHFKDGASWLSAFNLDSEGASLRFRSGSVAIDLSAERGKSAARLVSSPVIRVMTGEQWEFSADTQIPVPVLQRSEGVVSTAYEYREVGLGLAGVVRQSDGGMYRMHIEQRNGNVEASAKQAAGEPPQIREQVLKSMVGLELSKWSCVGGVRSWRTETKKRLFGSEDREEQDLLLIFCRPRRGLGGEPQAWQAGDEPPRLESMGEAAWETSGHPLLPDPPAARRGAKKSLEALEADFFEERAGVKRKPALGHPGRR